MRPKHALILLLVVGCGNDFKVPVRPELYKDGAVPLDGTVNGDATSSSDGQSPAVDGAMATDGIAPVDSATNTDGGLARDGATADAGCSTANNTFATAESQLFIKDLDGTLCQAGDHDFFLMQPGVDRTYTLTFDPAQGDLDLRIYVAGHPEWNASAITATAGSEVLYSPFQPGPTGYGYRFVLEVFDDAETSKLSYHLATTP